MRYYWDTHMRTYERLGKNNSLAWYSFEHVRWFTYRIPVTPRPWTVPDLVLILQGVEL